MRSVHDAERSCEKKRSYPSAGAAANAARVADALYPAAQPRKWYQCDRCHRFHLTTKETNDE